MLEALGPVFTTAGRVWALCKGIPVVGEAFADGTIELLGLALFCAGVAGRVAFPWDIDRNSFRGLLGENGCFQTLAQAPSEIQRMSLYVQSESPCGSRNAP